MGDSDDERNNERVEEHLTLWTWDTVSHYALLSYVRLWPGDPDDWSFTLHLHVYVNTCVLACTHTYTHTHLYQICLICLRCIQPAAPYWQQTSPQPDVWRSPRSSEITVSSHKYQTSPPSCPLLHVTPWQALSKAGQCGIHTQIIHAACRGSVLFNLKWTNLLL